MNNIPSPPFRSGSLKSKTCGEPRRTIENLKWAGILAIVFSLVIGGAGVQAQQSARLPRIGILFPASPTTFALRRESLLFGLRELGYVDGSTIRIEWRWADNDVERLPALAGELAALNVDMIVANGTPAIKAAKAATQTIPIVMVAIGDPVGTGLIESLAHPGGNVTGTSILAPELSGKRLELLREVVPRLSRVTAILNPTNPTFRTELRDAESAAKSLGLDVQTAEVSNLDTLQSTFKKLGRAPGQALIVFTDAILYSMRASLVANATKSRMPAMYWQREFADDGGLMSYGPFTNELFRRSAYYVDRILKGAQPANLPVEQPTKFEFVINLKTAKRIGLTIPPNVLARADRVIR